MIDELQKAEEFYLQYLGRWLRIEDKYEGGSYWDTSMFPLSFHDKAESMAFKEAFKDLDETEREQWFDHNYHQAVSFAFGEAERSAIKGREAFLLLLKVYILFKSNSWIMVVKLTRKYEFGKLIHACWIKNPVRLEDVREDINDIFDSCHFNVEEQGRGTMILL